MEVVVCDVDGVMDNFPKDVAPWNEDITPRIPNLNAIKEKISVADFKLALSTGRSLESSKEIIKLAGINALSAFEMGNVLYNPVTKETCDAVDLPNFRHLKYAAAALNDWRGYVLDNEHTIFGGLFDEGIQLRFLRDREKIFTYEILEGDFNGMDVYNALKKHFNGIGRYLSSGELIVLKSAKAVDIMPAVDKGAALVYVMSKLEFKPYQVAAVGDGSHSDIPMMKVAGFAACPANADEKMMEYVRTRGNRGFISNKKYTDGALDIFDYIGNGRARR